jgi:hypothetical protein
MSVESRQESSAKGVWPWRLGAQARQVHGASSAMAERDGHHDGVVPLTGDYCSYSRRWFRYMIVEPTGLPSRGDTWVTPDESSSFWARVRAESDSFQSYAHLQAPFARSICTAEDLGQVLSTMASDPATHTDAPMQVFVEGTRRASYETEILRSPPREDESFERWLACTFGANLFTMLVNNVERWSPKLASRVAMLASGLYREESYASISIEIAFVVGRYDLTPFGVHCDGEDLVIIHFALGPGGKSMVFWRPEHFVELTGSSRAFPSPEALLKDGEEVKLEPGDALLFPGQLYHIGRSRELSASLVLLLRRYSREAALREALRSELDDAIPPLSETVAEWMARAERNFLLRRESNGGLRSLPMPRICAESGLTTSSVRLLQPFEIKTAVAEGEVEVFVRGARIVLPDEPALVALIADVNSGRDIRVGEIVDRYSREVTGDAVLFLVSLLAAHGGIVVFRR